MFDTRQSVWYTVGTGKVYWALSCPNTIQPIGDIFGPIVHGPYTLPV